MKTLVIEDDLSSRIFLQAQLEAYGHEVTACVDAETALDAYQQTFYPLIISDLGLPEMDGLDLCRQIRALPQGERSMILVVTARNTSDDLQAVLDAGADDYLAKPIDPAALLIRLTIVERQAQHLIRRKEAEAMLRESEELHRLVLNSISDAVFITDADGRFTFICPSVATIFGYSQDEVAALKNIAQLLGAEVFNPTQLTADKEIRNIECKIGDKYGQHHVVLVNVKQVAIGGGTMLYSCRDVTERRQAEEELRYYRRTTGKDRYKLGEIIGKSAAMQEVYELMLQAAASDANVVVYGESGTGKELAAWTIHYMSARKEQAFVPVNCGAIPETLFESELFGHRKGAFTGASRDKVGFFDAADKGTVFLDEVGELSPAMQVKLLRAVAGDGYTPIGASSVRRPDVRIIAATNKDLTAQIKGGNMREDFFYRIHVIAITLPPLRERREDIPLLIEHFLRHYRPNQDLPTLPSHVLETLYAYNWPGNVRELQNVLQRYLTTGRLDFLETTDKPQPITAGQTIVLDPAGQEDVQDLPSAVDAFEKRLIAQALHHHRWERGTTAAALGISPRTLYRKMVRYHLKESYQELLDE